MLKGMRYLKKPCAELMDPVRINLSMLERKLGPEPVCDWCGAGVPVYVYASKRMSTGAMVPGWRWMACERCSRLVDNDNWDALERRLRVVLKTQIGERFAGAVFETLLIQAVHLSLDEFHKYAIVQGE